MGNIKKNFKKVISLLLVFTIILSQFSGVALATDTADKEAISYTVKTTDKGGWCLYIFNKTANSGPVTMTYTVDSFANVNTPDGRTGVVASANPFSSSAGRQYPYNSSTAGSSKHTSDPTFMLKEGYTYSITMSLDSSKMITYTGRYWTADGTEKELTELTGQAGSGGDAVYFGVYLQGKAAVSLSGVTFTDADGNDLGVNTNQNCHYIAPETDATAYSVNIMGQNTWTLLNQKETTGPVRLTYTVESYTATEQNLYSNNNGVTATKNTTTNYPYINGDGQMRYANSETPIATDNIVYGVMQPGYTYSLELTAEGNTLKYSGTCIDSNGVARMVTLDKNPAGSLTGEERYFGLYVAPTTTAKLVNVTCTDAEGNDLGLQSNRSITISSERDEEVTSYTVYVSGQNNWTLLNLKKSKGPVRLTYTVESYTATEQNLYSNNNGVTATRNTTANYPYDYGQMRYENSTTPTADDDVVYGVMQPGYTYSLELSVEGTTFVYSGTCVDSNGVVRKVSIDKSAGSLNGWERYFGLYVAPTTTAKLVNVTCTDAKGNNLGLQSNKASVHIVPEADASYTVKTTDKGGWCLYIFNKTANSGPVTMTYTVDSFANVNTPDGRTGVVASANPFSSSAGRQYPYNQSTAGSSKHTGDPSFMMQVGYTYSITMSLDASNKITYTGRYWTADGTEKELTELTGQAGSGGAAVYFGVYLQGQAAVSLSNVTFTDADGNDLGVNTNQNCHYIAPETDVTSYSVDITGQNNWTLLNRKETTGPVRLTYTVESYTATEQNLYSNNNGVTATKNTTTNYPYDAGNGQMRYANSTSPIETDNIVYGVMQPGYTYSLELTAEGTTLKYSGTCIDSNGVARMVTLDKNPAGSLTGAERYFGLYVAPTTTAKLVNVTCTDAEGNDLGIQSNKDVTIIYSENVDDATSNAYNVEIRGVNSFLCNAKTAGSEVGTEYYMTYTVDKVTALPAQLGVVGTEDYTIAFPYIDTGMLKYNYAENAPTLLEEGATYHIKFTVTEGGYDYNIYYVKGDEVKNVFFTKSYTEDKDGVPNTLDNLGYFGLWFGDGTKTVNLKDVSCYDSEGNDLGLWLEESKGLVYSKEELQVKKDTEVEQYYDIEVKNQENVAIGNVRLPETSKMYIEYKVESADYNLTQEGVFMSSSIMGVYPYTKGHLNYNNYKGGTTDSSMLLDVGAEYIICIERKETGFSTKVLKTRDGVTTLSIFDSMAKPSWSDDAQFGALWFGDYGNGGIASFKLTNFKCYDENKNELGVQCNKEATIVPKTTIVHHVDVDESKISKYNVMIGAVNTFLSNAKTIGSEVGTEYYMTYTVDKVTALPMQLGVIGTEDYSIPFPYIDLGMLKYGYAENTPTLLEEGATYHIKFTVTKSGYDYNIYYVKGDEVKNVFFTKSYTEDKDKVPNTLDNLGYFGLWFGDGTDLVSLTNVSCFDGDGNDLGIWFAESKGVISKDKIEVKTNPKVGQYYDIEVKNQENVAIGNVKFPKTSKMYIEYKVESADYNLTQEGVFMSSSIMGVYPYTKGHLNYNNYKGGTTDSSMLLDIGARYRICIERSETGFTTQVLKTKDGVTTLSIFNSMAKITWSEEVNFFALWFGDYGNGGIASFKLTDFKCYDENNNNLGVQCNKNVPITKRGTVEDYGLCEATYYCEANGSYFVLDKDQTLKFVNNDSVSKGKYTVSLPNINVVVNGTKHSYDYLYSKITDSEGQEYVRLYNYKMTFETGTDYKVETQSFSNENGYLATRPENPTLKGYDFLGWYMADGTEYNFDNMVTESVTLYAKYSNGGGIIFAAEDEILPQPIDKELVLGVVSGAVILLGGCVACILMIKRGKKSGRDSQK